MTPEPDKAPNPYYWRGDVLMHVDGHPVAHLEEFPQLVKSREHRQRLEEKITSR